MKFSVSQSALMRALAVVGKGMSTSSTIPMQSGVYVRAAEGMLEFQTTDLTISIRYRIQANVEEGGETVISGKLLTNIVKALPDAAVTFEGEGHTMRISCGRSTYDLHTLEAADFPEFPEVDLDQSIELPSGVLSKMVDKVYRVTSKDTSRPVLTGVQLSVAENTIRLVATDSYRLAVCDSNVETSSSAEAFSCIVAGSTFHDVLALPSMTDRLTIGTSDKQVVFDFGDTTYVSRRIEGNFPDYTRMLPRTCATAVTMKVEELAAALKHVSVIALSNPGVRFDIDPDGGLVTVSASSPDQGEATEEVGAKVEGESMRIGFNYHYALDCVNAVSQEDEVTLELQGPTMAGVFKSYSTINYLYMLMPMRV